MIEVPLEDYDDIFYVEWGIVSVNGNGGTHNEVMGNVYYLNQEVEEWLEDNGIPEYYDPVSMVFEFENEEDAVLFKLTWCK